MLIYFKIFLFFVVNSVVGLYTSKNESYPFDSNVYIESLQLLSDSSFVYKEKLGSFTKTKTTGKWQMIEDFLVLNSGEKYKNKMEAFENIDSGINKGCIKITAQNFDESLLIYHVRIRNRRNQIVELRDISDESVIVKVKGVKEITVITPSLEFPVYQVANLKANEFVFNLVPNRVFINEKWLIEESKIFPKNFNGNKADYHLKLVTPQ